MPLEVSAGRRSAGDALKIRSADSRNRVVAHDTRFYARHAFVYTTAYYARGHLRYTDCRGEVARGGRNEIFLRLPAAIPLDLRRSVKRDRSKRHECA